jgi:uncharacterized protein (DUF39 family)
LKTHKINKTYKEINKKIQSGDVVVVTAEEMVGIVKDAGPEEAAHHVDVVTTGTFAPMCSSGAFINFGHATPKIRATHIWFNNVPAYGMIAAVDCYLGATATSENDPLNRAYPGDFNYGGGHVISDLAAGKTMHFKASGYPTDCYPNHLVEKESITLDDLPQVTLCNPRNSYQNYNCAINRTNKTIYTYMGTLKPRMGNANYSTSGELSPLFNDPYYLTIGMGTRIFLGGGEGYVAWYGTQHDPHVNRTERGVPVGGAGTLWTMGDLKKMSPRWLVGMSIRGYGCSLAVGIGVPIPILNEDMARYTSISDKDIYTQVIDYGHDYGQGISKSYAQVSYAELKSGSIRVEGQDVPSVPLSSMVKAREIAETLRRWIVSEQFTLGEPVFTLPRV